MAKVNLNAVLLRAANSSAVARPLREKVDAYVEVRKAKALEMFNENPVTEEILGGNASENLSETLNGKGNLYGFLGMGQSPEDIIDPVRNLIVNIPPVKKISNIARNTATNTATVDFQVTLPDKNDIAAVSAMSHLDGRSWALGVEDGNLKGYGWFVQLSFIRNSKIRERLSDLVGDSRTGESLEFPWFNKGYGQGGPGRGGRFQAVKGGYIWAIIKRMAANLREKNFKFKV
jgi:hypothetical protein